MMNKKLKATNTDEMLHVIINGQSAMKSELLKKIGDLDEKLGGRIDSLESKVDDGFKKVNERLDNIGASVAYLEDDTPTREEHNKLEKRMRRVEKKLALS